MDAAKEHLANAGVRKGAGMIERSLIDQSLESRARPLCGSYFLAIHDRLTIQLLDRHLVREEIFHWALGVLVDGSFEVLAVWAPPKSGSWTWEEAAECLKARGLEKVGLVCEFGLESSPDLPPRRARTFRASREVMVQLRTRASGAIKRRGHCSDLADATAFVESALSRAEQRIATAGTSVEMAVRNLVGRPARSRTNSAVLGL